MALQHELDMAFNYDPVLYGTIKSGIGDEMNKETRVYKLLCQAQEDDRYLCVDDKENCQQIAGAGGI